MKKFELVTSFEQKPQTQRVAFRLMIDSMGDVQIRADIENGNQGILVGYFTQKGGQIILELMGVQGNAEFAQDDHGFIAVGR